MQWGRASGCLSTVIIEMPSNEVECESVEVQKKRGGTSIQMAETSTMPGMERVADADIRTNAAPNQRTLVSDIVCHI
jgi:hypothetical protein